MESLTGGKITVLKLSYESMKPIGSFRPAREACEEEGMRKEGGSRE